MQIDPSKVQWDDAPAIDPAAVTWDDAAPNPPQQPQRSGFDNLARQVGLTARYGLEGLGQAADIVAAPINALTGGTNPSKSAEQFSDWMGLPKPEGTLERVVGDATRMGFGAGGFMGAGAAATKAGMTALGGFLGANPTAQAVSAASSGAAGAAARESNASPTMQTLAALAGAMAPTGVQLAKNAAQGAVKHSVGLATGAGSDAIGEAYKAGKQGNQTFLNNMRGHVGASDVVDDVHAGLAKMQADRTAQYRSGMLDIKADKSVLNFTPIEQAVGDVKQMGSYKGVPIYQKAAGTVGELDDLVKQWKALPADEFHTPEGLDALKKAVGDIRARTQYGTAERVAADRVYNAVKAEITKQAPTYSNVMKNFSAATETIDEIRAALSAGKKSSVDTQLRKLQSVLRNNANTNYGNRQQLVKALEQRGEVELMPALAGQALNSWTPRGLQQIPTTLGAGALAATNPLLLPSVTLTSPRLMGETAYHLGILGRYVPSAPQGLFGGGARVLPLAASDAPNN